MRILEWFDIRSELEEDEISLGEIGQILKRMRLHARKNLKQGGFDNWLAMIIGLWRDNGKERTPGKFHELWRLIIQHLWSQTLRFGLPEPPQYKTHPPHSLHPHWLCKSPRWIFHEVEFHLFDFSPLCVFLNVSQNDLLQRRHDYTGCISLTFLHCVFSNLSSNWINHLLQSSIRQVDKIFSLGAVTVPWFLLTKVVCCVVVLDKIKFNILCLMYEVLVLVLEFLGTGTWTPYMCWYLEVGIWYLVLTWTPYVYWYLAGSSG